MKRVIKYSQGDRQSEAEIVQECLSDVHAYSISISQFSLIVAVQLIHMLILQIRVVPINGNT